MVRVSSPIVRTTTFLLASINFVVHPADADAVTRLAFVSSSASLTFSEISPSSSQSVSISTKPGHCHRNCHPPPPRHRARLFRVRSHSSHNEDSSRISTKTKAQRKRSPPPSSEQQQQQQQQQQLHLLTFDLDDTLFPIQPVLDDANDAMVRAMHRLGYTDVRNEDVVVASKMIRRELRDLQRGGGVMTYTDLRKASIRRVLECYFLTGSCSSSAAAVRLGKSTIHESVVNHVFDTWLSERHASANRSLFPSAVQMLRQIRMMRTTHNHDGSVQNDVNNRNDEDDNDYNFKTTGEEAEASGDVIIGAITNGRGNPFDMPSISSYFDFCISGEDEGVFPRRKPDRGIYEAALRRYRELVMVGTKNGGVGGSARTQDEDDDIVLNWIHFSWLIEESLQDDGGDVVPSWSTATNEELEKRAKMDEMARQHVSAKIGKLDELPDVITHILQRNP
ncbi:hypothetical protein ACHAXS_013565 [Conticribra weissflogii]